MKIQDYFKKKKIICDGAFGTYFADKYGVAELPERLNGTKQEWMRQIHKEYLEAGAVLLRTNTFAANRMSLCCGEEALRENIRAAWENALQAAKDCGRTLGEDCFIAGDIGPLPDRIGRAEDEVYREYRLIADTFTEAGADILIFETFSHMDDILPVIRDMKEERELFVIVQFCVNQHGYSSAGISARRLLAEAAQSGAVDAAGFNCGVGPAHLYRILEKMELPENIYLTALPNAGYPKYMEKRRVFGNSAEYFAGKMGEIGALNVAFLGGCCGTAPSFTQKLCESADMAPVRTGTERRQVTVRERAGKECGFWQGKVSGKKLIAVELSPPPGADDGKVMEGAFWLRQKGADVVTFPDSPSGRTRADSVLTAMKVRQETKLCVMPHICCRDKNAIAMRSQLLGAYVNGIRNLLVVTGDPVPMLMRQDVKSVFNFDSVGLMKIIRELNQEEFAAEPMVFGGALNQGRHNLDVEVRRVEKKMAQGASFFLTQPVFTEAAAKRLKEVKERTGARILCGIMPLVNLRNALFMKNEMVGIGVDDEVLSCFHAKMTREEGEMAGVGIAKKVMDMTDGFVDGYYFSIPFNRVYLLDDILDWKNRRSS